MTYVRTDDKAVMVEIGPNVYVSEKAARTLGLLRTNAATAREKEAA
jgi:hypothetical protein